MSRDEKLTHLDADGQVSMVDVGAKPVSDRIAIASGSVVMKAETLAMIREGNLKKGDLLGAARIAGIMAAKRTADLIPLCHPIALDKIAVDLEFDERQQRDRYCRDRQNQRCDRGGNGSPDRRFRCGLDDI